jgi:hypothetical protein
LYTDARLSGSKSAQKYLDYMMLDGNLGVRQARGVSR